MQGVVVLLALSIAVAALLNESAYDTRVWKEFQEFNLARAPYTDFRAGNQVKSRPDVLARHGYSPNDIDLISSWFFVDPKLSDPPKLNAMLADVGLRTWIHRGFDLGFQSSRMLFADQLWPILACALVLVLISPSRMAIVLIALVAGAIFALGAIGRPGVTRVQYPLCALILLVAVYGLRESPRWARSVAGLALVLAGSAVAQKISSYQLDAKSRVVQAQRQLQELPKDTLAVWGPTFPSEAAFPPFTEIVKAHSVKIYPMGVSTTAPYSVAVVEEATGNGFMVRLTTKAGTNISVSQPQLEMLRIYCVEHFNLRPTENVIYESDALVIRNVKCIRNSD